MKHLILSLILIVTVIVSGCTTLNIVANTIRSNEQIELNEKEDKYDKVKKEFKAKEANLATTLKEMEISLSVKEGKIPAPVVQARRNYLEIKELYVELLKAAIDLKIAGLNKQARQAGYFALGNKAVGIGSGIASAALVVASPANAVWVAGLTTFSTGLIAFEGRAEELGFSTLVANIKNDAIKKKAAKALGGFNEINFEYLYPYSSNATQKDWTTAMQKIGNAILKLEVALRYTPSNVVIKIEGQ